MSHSKKLFCIIEEDTVRLFMEEVFKKAGWEVYSLENTNDAEFRIPEFEPDYIVLDTALVAPQREIIKTWETGKAKIFGLGFIGEKELWGDEIHDFLEKPLGPLNLVEKLEAGS